MKKVVVKIIILLCRTSIGRPAQKASVQCCKRKTFFTDESWFYKTRFTKHANKDNLHLYVGSSHPEKLVTSQFHKKKIFPIFSSFHFFFSIASSAIGSPPRVTLFALLRVGSKSEPIQNRSPDVGDLLGVSVSVVTFVSESSSRPRASRWRQDQAPAFTTYRTQTGLERYPDWFMGADQVRRRSPTDKSGNETCQVCHTHKKTNKQSTETKVERVRCRINVTSVCQRIIDRGDIRQLLLSPSKTGSTRGFGRE